MNSEDFEKTLYNGKKQSESFFSRTDYAAARNGVHQKILSREAKRTKPLWPFALKAGFTAALMVGVAAVLLIAVFGIQGAGVSIPGEAVASQTVALNKGSDDYLLNYFPVTAPHYSEPGLMSVLWEMSNENSQMVYSTMFEKCDETYPASMISFPDTNRNLALIYSGDSDAAFIDYRLIGSRENAVKVWWSQDYVQDGNLEVKDGVLVEKRSVDNGFGLNTMISYIVPYDLKETGEIVLPAKSLQIHVGEIILLVGSDSQMLEVSSENGLFEMMPQVADVYGQNEALAYRAKAAGDDILQVIGKNAYDGYLDVNISE